MASEFSTFVLSETTVNQIRALPVELRLIFYEAVSDYGLHGIEPEFTGLENVIWIGIRDLILHTKRKDEKWKQKQQNNGKKGGRPKENPENPNKPSETQTNPENPNKPSENEETHNDNDNKNYNDKNNENIGFSFSNFFQETKTQNELQEPEPPENNNHADFDTAPPFLEKPPDKPAETKEDATATFNKAVSLWNLRKIPPQCRNIIIPPGHYECLPTFQNYSWPEIENAIMNYHFHLCQIEKGCNGWKTPPPYGSIYGFLKTGVARYFDDEAFKKQFREA